MSRFFFRHNWAKDRRGWGIGLSWHKGHRAVYIDAGHLAVDFGTSPAPYRKAKP